MSGWAQREAEYQEDRERYRDGLELQLADRDEEIARLTNAAKSRLKCPNGHSPKDSRGACWFCDAEANAAKLERVRDYSLYLLSSNDGGMMGAGQKLTHILNDKEASR